MHIARKGFFSAVHIGCDSLASGYGEIEATADGETVCGAYKLLVRCYMNVFS